MIGASTNNQPAPPAPRSLGPSKPGRCFASRELIWDGLNLRLGRGRVVATVEPDAKLPKMYRVRLSNGNLTDMVNLTRAKDAAISIALADLNSPRQDAAA